MIRNDVGLMYLDLASRFWPIVLHLVVLFHCNLIIHIWSTSEFCLFCSLGVHSNFMSDIEIQISKESYRLNVLRASHIHIYR